MSWANNNIFSRWEHLWSEEGIALCIAIVKGKDQLYFDQLSVATAAAKIKADVKKILEPMWAVQKAKPAPKPALKLPFTRPTASPSFAKASPSFAPTRSSTVTRPCCVGCKKFQIHPNPPPHFTPEDMAHCCALCRLSSGKRHGDHCSRQKA